MADTEKTSGSTGWDTGPDEFAGLLLDVLADSGDVDELLDEIVQLAAERVPGVETASITMLSADGPSTVAASDSRARYFDDLQYQSGSGPCLAAATSGLPQHVSDLTDLLSPEARGAVQEFRVQAVLSVPMITPAVIIGSLNLYLAVGHSPEWPEHSLESAELLAGHSDAALSVAHRLRSSRQLIEAYQTEIDNRQVIERAVGMIMASRGCDAVTAYRSLERFAQDAGMSMKAQATRIVAESAVRRRGRLRVHAPSSGARPSNMVDDKGIRASELGDQELRHELQHLHDTRHQTLTSGSESALENHTGRMLELEQEFLRRFPLENAPDPQRTRAGSRELAGQEVPGRDVSSG